MKIEGNVAQLKEQRILQKIKLKKPDVYVLPEKECKITVVKMLKELKETMHEKNRVSTKR